MEKCYLCNSSEQDEIKYGEFMTRNGDIKKEVTRVQPMVCRYCKKKGANIACCAKKCRKSFHLICGIKNDCENQFVDTFKSFCHRHISKRKTRGLPDKDEKCCICYDNLLDEDAKYNSVTMLQAPCCKNGWFHKWCLASFAKSAGYFFKCPLCNDSNKFRENLVYRGIFIPDRDASWELEPNAYSELLERPGFCSAEECVARGGRTSNSRRNKLTLCLGCGSVGMHRCCIENKADNFYCKDCQETFTEVNDETVVNVSRHSESDEEEDVDICGEVEDETVVTESANSDETVRSIGRLRNERLSTTDDEASFDVNVTDTEEDVILRPRHRQRVNRLCSFDDDSESSDEVKCVKISGCKRNARIESSDSGNSMETVICEAKLRTSNNSESFFDSGAGSDRSDISADRSHSVEKSKNDIKEPTYSRSEKIRGSRRFTSLNNEPSGDWCIARRTRRQSLYAEMKLCSEEPDKSKEPSTCLPKDSSCSNVFQIPEKLKEVEKEQELKTESKAKGSNEISLMENITTRRLRTRRSKSQCIESPKSSSTLRRSSLQTSLSSGKEPGCSSLRTNKLVQIEASSNKRSRNDSLSSTDVNQNKRQKSDYENENNCTNEISCPRRRSSRSRSPLGMNYSSSINAFITPTYIKEKQGLSDGVKEGEDCLKRDTLKPRIEKMLMKNQKNVLNQRVTKDKPTTSTHKVLPTSSESSSSEMFRETFSNSYTFLLSAKKRRRSRKNAFQRHTDKSVPSNQTRIETFFKRI